MIHAKVFIQSTAYRVSVRFFSTSNRNHRNKTLIYNCDDRPEPVLDEKFREKLLNGYKHPRSLAIVVPSQDFTKSVLNTLDKVYTSHKEHLRSYHEAGHKLAKFIKHRKVPMEEAEVKAKKASVEDRIKKEFSLNFIDRDDNPDPKMLKRLEYLEKNAGCKWAPIDFDETGSLTYLVTRAAAEFASLVNIFKTIKEEDRDFKPRTLFDFGSGVCSSLWAGREIFGHFSEGFFIDSSKHINDLARVIIDNGAKSGGGVPSTMSFRLQMPNISAVKYDLVVCSNTLLELPSTSERLETLSKLWDRVEKGGYLVLAETGTNAGFHVIAEARDYLIQMSQMPEIEEEVTRGHSVAPCPHESSCPRHSHDTVPCNFPVRYQNFDIPELNPKDIKTDLVSYFVFKKEPRQSISKPRLVEAPLKVKSCIYCRVCTINGTLQETLARKNKDKDLYQLAKLMKWGDQLPVSLKRNEEKKKVGTPWMKNKNKMTI